MKLVEGYRNPEGGEDTRITVSAFEGDTYIELQIGDDMAVKIQARQVDNLVQALQRAKRVVSP